MGIVDKRPAKLTKTPRESKIKQKTRTVIPTDNLINPDLTHDPNKSHFRTKKFAANGYGFPSSRNFRLRIEEGTASRHVGRTMRLPLMPGRFPKRLDRETYGHVLRASLVVIKNDVARRHFVLMERRHAVWSGSVCGVIDEKEGQKGLRLREMTEALPSDLLDTAEGTTFHIPHSKVLSLIEANQAWKRFQARTCTLICVVGLCMSYDGGWIHGDQRKCQYQY